MSFLSQNRRFSATFTPPLRRNLARDTRSFTNLTLIHSRNSSRAIDSLDFFFVVTCDHRRRAPVHETTQGHRVRSWHTTKYCDSLCFSAVVLWSNLPAGRMTDVPR